MMVWPFPFEISYAYRPYHFFHTFYRPFLYLFGLHPTVHPTTNLHPFLPSSMFWVLFEANYAIFKFISFFEDIVIIEGFDSLYIWYSHYTHKDTCSRQFDLEKPNVVALKIPTTRHGHFGGSWWSLEPFALLIGSSILHKKRNACK